MTSRQRKYLRGLAHALEPVLQIGKQGVTEASINAIDEALEAHELIKIRFNDFKDDKTELADEIARKTQAEIAGAIGHVVILYRQHPDPDRRVIRLP